MSLSKVKLRTIHVQGAVNQNGKIPFETQFYTRRQMKYQDETNNFYF